MSEWRRRWIITLRWDDPRHSPWGQDQRVFTVDAHELGKMVRAARADPHIVAFPFEAKWEREGDEPTQCPNGHPFGGGSANRPHIAWYECPACPGHYVRRCRQGNCPESLDPPPGPDCRPGPPVLTSNFRYAHNPAPRHSG